MMSNDLKLLIRAVLCVFGLFAGTAASAADLLGVRFGPNGAVTRVVFDISGDVKYAIAGEEIGSGRLLIDFSGLSVKPEFRAYLPGKGHVARYGFAPSDAGMRAILDFGKTAKIKEAFMLPPSGAVKKHRLVVDLETADKTAFMASLPKTYPDLGAVIEKATAATPDPVIIAPAPSQKEVAAPSKGKAKYVVVIDPGHGGGDPGSQGQSGTFEKNVTLSAAVELKKTLEKTGRFEVVLTRESDKDPKIKSSQKAELARREKLARNAGADLFISLHADAISNKAVRGGSVYTLSQQGSERSAKLAKSDGNYQAYEIFNEKVGDILLDVARSETNTASSQLADLLIKNLAGKTPLLNRSHRTGDLRVLLAPDVPAVLFEMAFISNVKDEANLNSKAWRRRTMKAVAEAIEGYFDEYGRLRVASSKAAGAK